jgi:hypothetical protein
MCRIIDEVQLVYTRAAHVLRPQVRKTKSRRGMWFFNCAMRPVRPAALFVDASLKRGYA